MLIARGKVSSLGMKLMCLLLNSGKRKTNIRTNRIGLKKIKQNLLDTTNSNSAAIFIDYGKNRLTEKKGILSFIVPKSLLYSENWFTLVESMLGNVSILVD